MIKTSVRGVEQLKAFFAKLPPAARKIAAFEIAIHLIGDDTRGLRHYVGYRYVSRKSAYGQTFSSDKQRRYVMAKIRSGEIAPGSPHRTNTLKRGWEFKRTGGGYGAQIYNAVPYAGYVMGDNLQARQPAKVGWRTMGAVISTNIKSAIKRAERVIQDWINKNSK
jgi:hypothetical protein